MGPGVCLVDEGAPERMGLQGLHEGFLENGFTDGAIGQTARGSKLG